MHEPAAAGGTPRSAAAVLIRQHVITRMGTARVALALVAGDTNPRVKLIVSEPGCDVRKPWLHAGDEVTIGGAEWWVSDVVRRGRGAGVILVRSEPESP